MLQSLLLQRFSDFAGSVPFGDAADIQTDAGIGQIHGVVFLIDFHLVPTAAGFGLFQLLLIRNPARLSLTVQFKPFFPILMPDLQHGAHRHIEFTAGQIVEFAGRFQQIDDFIAHFDRLNSGVIVDRFDVVETIVVVVDVKQRVVAQEFLPHRIEILCEFLFRFGKARQCHDGIETGVQRHIGIAVQRRFRFLLSATAQHQQRAERESRDFFLHFHHP